QMNNPAALVAANADFCQEWMDKADKSLVKDIHLRTAMIGCFEGLKCINTNNQALHAYLINSMPFDRDSALKFDDKLATNPLRKFIYGVHASVEAAMRGVAARPIEAQVSSVLPAVQQRPSGQQHQVQLARPDVVPTIPAVQQGPPQQKKQVELARPAIIPSIQQAPSRRQNQVHQAGPVSTHAVQQRPAREQKRAQQSIVDSGTSSSVIVVKREVKVELVEDVEDVMETPMEEVPLNQGNEVVGSIPPQMDMLVDGEFQVKEEVDMDDEQILRRRAQEQQERMNAADNNSNEEQMMVTPIRGGFRGVAPVNSDYSGSSKRTLNCRLCPSESMALSGFTKHLKNAHHTTPGIEGLGFRCVSCGFEAYSYKFTFEHTKTCKSSELTLITKKSQ
ncbi:hypothetical protein PMAYCL1PPCAC_08828, partial [Pristionchus mayeri]